MGGEDICLPSGQGLENVNIFYVNTFWKKNSQIFLYLYGRILTSIVKLGDLEQKFQSTLLTLADIPGNLKSNEFENYYEKIQNQKFLHFNQEASKVMGIRPNF